MRCSFARRTHKVENEVDVAVVVGLDHVEQPDDVGVAVQLLQIHHLAEGALRVRRVAERIKALFERHDLPRVLVNCLPDDPVRLGRCEERVNTSAMSFTTLKTRPATAMRLTPLPSFCSSSYLRRMCFSTSSPIALADVCSLKQVAAELVAALCRRR
jgi:hypothetical protein